jgi:hypothetical protein
MDWIFELHDGPRVFMSASENGSEGRVHIALKLLGLLMLADSDPEMEPRRGAHHRKYKPDVISGDGSIWCEAGRVSRGKLIEVASLRSVRSLMVMKRGDIAARDVAKNFPVDTVADVVFYGWDPCGVDELADAVSGHSHVAMLREDGDHRMVDGEPVVRDVSTYRLCIDGRDIRLSCIRYMPGQVRS